MIDFDLQVIAAELNDRSKAHPIGQLQSIRSDLRNLSRQPGSDIFRLTGSSKTVFPNWAFHLGGRSELQFNIGVEHDSGTAEFRHGIAFSFETSRTLPSIDALARKVPLFNEFLQLWPERFAEMRMWHFRAGKRSDTAMPGAIAPELIQNGVFVVLGKRQAELTIDFEQILEDFDRLLPLYRYVESGGRAPPVSMPTTEAFGFRAGCTTKSRSAIASHSETALDVNLRHNLLQESLFERLSAEFGAENVGAEIPTGVGTSIDLVVRHPSGFWFYEIKTYSSPRACIREALGQILEYSFWPGAHEPSRMIVVGECALDQDGAEYLRRLRTRYARPIEYEQLVIRESHTSEEYTAERKAEFLLNNFVGQPDYEEARAEVVKLGIDPDEVPHNPPITLP